MLERMLNKFHRVFKSIRKRFRFDEETNSIFLSTSCGRRCILAFTERDVRAFMSRRLIFLQYLSAKQKISSFFKMSFQHCKSSTSHDVNLICWQRIVFFQQNKYLSFIPHSLFVCLKGSTRRGLIKDEYNAWEE
jgi:hypothetical protein